MTGSFERFRPIMVMRARGRSSAGERQTSGPSSSRSVGRSRCAADGFGQSSVRASGSWACAVARQAFAEPDLIRRRLYRDVLSAYLRGDGISPLPIRRLVAGAGPDAADRAFREPLKKPGFGWERDGEALLGR